MELPERFVWARVGWNAHETLDRIRHRKELERQLGDGLFFWGTGQEIKEHYFPLLADKNKRIPVLFSSKQKADDPIPDDPIVFWSYYIDRQGKETPIPRTTLVTSVKRDKNFALMCSSSTSVSTGTTNYAIHISTLQDVKTEKRIAGQRTTAPAKYVDSLPEKGHRYAVAFTAQLHLDYCVQLCHPKPIRTDDISFLQNSNKISKTEWSSFMNKIYDY